jgi:hypothetical protein
MKKSRLVIILMILAALFLATMNVMSSPASANTSIKPHRTPEAKATKAFTPLGNGGEPGPGNGNEPGNWNGPNDGNSPGNGNGQGSGIGPGNGNGGLKKTLTPKPDNQDKPRKRKYAVYQGTINAVDSSSLTLALKNGASVTFVLNSDTKVKIPTMGNTGAIADLLVSEKVTVSAYKTEDDSLVASMIMVIPGKPVKIHHVGNVTDYQAGASITIQSKDGDLTTFIINNQTKILPKDRIDELAVGVVVTIIAPRDVTSNQLVAAGIVIHPPQATKTKTPGTSTPTEIPTPTPTDTPTPTPTETPTTES